MEIVKEHFLYINSVWRPDRWSESSVQYRNQWLCCLHICISFGLLL